MVKKLSIKINRKLPLGTHKFSDLCNGAEGLGVMKKIFGKNCKKILEKLNVRVSKMKMYAYIDDSKGMIVISKEYLSKGKEAHLGLDLIHELVHIRQLKEGKELFDKNYRYVDRPTEIEAYKIAAKEAKRIGMKEKELLNYLEVDWQSKEESERLLKNIGVK